MISENSRSPLTILNITKKNKQLKIITKSLFLSVNFLVSLTILQGRLIIKSHKTLTKGVLIMFTTMTRTFNKTTNITKHTNTTMFFNIKKHNRVVES